MNSYLKEALEKVPGYLLLVFYLGYLGFDFYNFNNSPDSLLSNRLKEISLEKENKKKLDTKMREAKEFVKLLEVRKEGLQRLSLELDGLKGALSEKIDMPKFMKMVTIEAKNSKILVESLKPIGSHKKEDYDESLLLLKFKGTFYQLLVFFERLFNLVEIIGADSLIVKKAGDSFNETSFLFGELTLKTYQYGGSHADALGKEGQNTFPEKYPPVPGVLNPGTTPGMFNLQKRLGS